MQWYLKVVKDNYANFEGRARRAEYWYFFLINMAIIIFLEIFFFIGLFGEIIPLAVLTGLILFVYAFATFIPGLAVSVRRLHDTNKSGLYIFMSLIPLVGGILVLIAMATDGDPGQNSYGPSPKHGAAGGGYPGGGNPGQFGAPQQYGAPGQQYGAPGQQPGYQQYGQ